MKQKLVKNLWLVALLLLAMAMGLWIFSLHMGDSAGQLKQDARSIDAQSARLMIDLRSLQAKRKTMHLRPTEFSSSRVEKNYALVINHARHLAAIDGVIVGRVRVKSVGGASTDGSGGELMGAVATKVHGALGVKSIHADIQGMWSNLPYFKRWLAAFESAPDAITSIDISANRFKIGVSVYGR